MKKEYGVRSRDELIGEGRIETERERIIVSHSSILPLFPSFVFLILGVLISSLLFWRVE